MNDLLVRSQVTHSMYMYTKFSFAMYTVLYSNVEPKEVAVLTL